MNILENEIISFKEANKIFQDEERKIADIKKYYEKKNNDKYRDHECEFEIQEK
ncbi:hypothetical protein [Clostridium sardiniense]|uniref:hypothetical protein n=1 Tax=Clostridium sardiniense TaxID=29369 RepID=UPI00195C8C90|nr:hypothetical protein [Clostridium sardiniense]MBM7835584.1 hypothetical protein [Clostridium sardiniense]